MKLDLVLCLATAAYAAPVPGVGRVQEVRKRIPANFEESIKEALQRLSDKWRGSNEGKRRYAQAAELVDIQRKVQKVLDKHSENVDKLRAEVQELTEMQRRNVVFDSPTWINWRDRYMKSKGVEVTNINEVKAFAEKNLELNEKSLKSQRNTLDEVKELWNDFEVPLYDKALRGTFI
jgi:hypothetical protein